MLPPEDDRTSICTTTSFSHGLLSSYADQNQNSDRLSVSCEDDFDDSDSTGSPPGAAFAAENSFLGISSYCFARIDGLQRELAKTQEQLNAANSQLEDTKLELSAAIHDRNHHKRMREHQQRIIDQTLEAKETLEAKLDELETLLDADSDRYMQFRQQTVNHLLEFEGEIDFLKSELFVTKRDNLLDKWKNINLSDEVAYLTAINSLLKQKIVTLESQATRHNALLMHEQEVALGHRETIKTLEKQYLYFKNRCTEVERQSVKAQLDLEITQDILKGREAKVQRLEEKLGEFLNAAPSKVQAGSEKQVVNTIKCTLSQLQCAKSALAKLQCADKALID